MGSSCADSMTKRWRLDLAVANAAADDVAARASSAGAADKTAALTESTKRRDAALEHSAILGVLMCRRTPDDVVQQCRGDTRPAVPRGAPVPSVIILLTHSHAHS